MGAYKYYNPSTQQWEIVKSKSIIKPDGSLEYTPDDIKNIDDKVGGLENDFNEHKADGTSHVFYGLASGTNAKTITLSPVPTSLVEGFAVSFKNNTQNTGAVTLNVNSLGAKSVLKANGSALASGNLKANSIYTVRYNGTNFILQGEGGSGNAIASDLLSGKTASTDAGDITGTMPNRGAVNITPSATNQVIPSGYHDGSGLVYGDSDLVAENIKNGVDIFGVVGNLKLVAVGNLTSTAGINTVSGLAFNPTKVIVYSENILTTLLDTIILISNTADLKFPETGNVNVTNMQVRQQNETIDFIPRDNSINANSFSFEAIFANTPIRWIAVQE